MQVLNRRRRPGTVATSYLFLLSVFLLPFLLEPASTLAQEKAADDPAIANSGNSKGPGEKKSDSTEDQIIELRKQLADQQRQINELRQLVQQQRGMVPVENARASEAVASGPVNAEPAALGTDSASVDPASARSTGTSVRQDQLAQESQPLSLRIGSAYLTPVGFMDFAAVFRSTNVGSGLGTNFGSIPFNNTAAGKLSEVRLTAQNSRIGFRVDANVKGSRVIGYFESDFLGSVPGNIAVTTNSASNRLRLYWVDVRKGKLELLGGQSWSMLTPGRKGLSPLTEDLFYTQVVDPNLQAGLVWGRVPQFRIVYHPNDTIALGLSLENPEQYIGGSAGGSLITLPSGLVNAYAGELNNGNTSLTVPNLHPDIIAKLTFDPKIANHSLHIEAAGLVRTFRLYNPLNQQYFSATGGGGSLNINFEVMKNFRLVSNNFYSDGGGRWIFGQAPDLIVRGDGSPSLIHSGSTVTGFEAQVTKDTLLYGYYGGVYIQRNTSIDPVTGKLVGYGYAGSPSGQNRVIHEATFGFTHTFWRDPKYGALQFMGQYSYLLRRPWSAEVGEPSEAHSNMMYLNLRYLLPGSAPKMK